MFQLSVVFRFAYLLEAELRFKPKHRKIASFIMLASDSYKGYRMAKNGNKSKSTTAGKSDLKWINVRLSDEDRASFEQWDPSPDELLTGVIQMAESGINFSLRASKTSNGTWDCFCIGDEDSIDYGGRGFSSFASTPYDACKVALFKHFHVLREQWPASDQVGNALYG